MSTVTSVQKLQVYKKLRLKDNYRTQLDIVFKELWLEERITQKQQGGVGTESEAWNALSYTQQARYLKEHPKSKRQITAKPTKNEARAFRAERRGLLKERGGRGSGFLARGIRSLLSSDERLAGLKDKDFREAKKKIDQNDRLIDKLRPKVEKLGRIQLDRNRNKKELDSLVKLKEENPKLFSRFSRDGRNNRDKLKRLEKRDKQLEKEFEKNKLDKEDFDKFRSAVNETDEANKKARSAFIDAVKENKLQKGKQKIEEIDSKIKGVQNKLDEIPKTRYDKEIDKLSKAESSNQSIRSFLFKKYGGEQDKKNRKLRNELDKQKTDLISAKTKQQVANKKEKDELEKQIKDGNFFNTEKYDQLKATANFLKDKDAFKVKPEKEKDKPKNDLINRFIGQYEFTEEETEGEAEEEVKVDETTTLQQLKDIKNRLAENVEIEELEDQLNEATQEELEGLADFYDDVDEQVEARGLDKEEPKETEEFKKQKEKVGNLIRQTKLEQKKPPQVKVPSNDFGRESMITDINRGALKLSQISSTGLAELESRAEVLATTGTDAQQTKGRNFQRRLEDYRAEQDKKKPKKDKKKPKTQREDTRSEVQERLKLRDLELEGIEDRTLAGQLTRQIQEENPDISFEDLQDAVLESYNREMGFDDEKSLRTQLNDLKRLALDNQIGITEKSLILAKEKYVGEDITAKSINKIDQLLERAKKNL